MDIVKSIVEAFTGKQKKTAPKATKTVSVDGKNFDVPEGFDASINAQELDIEKQIKAGLLGEEQAAEGMIGEIAKQEDSTINDLRRGAAQALATQRGLVEGGRGLALARGTANEAATKEASFRSGFASQLGDARQAAAAAKTQRLIEEGKLLGASKERLGSVAKAQANVGEIKSRYEGTLYTSEADFANMAAELDTLAASTTNPAEAAIYATAANKARNNELP